MRRACPVHAGRAGHERAVEVEERCCSHAAAYVASTPLALACSACSRPPRWPSPRTPSATRSPSASSRARASPTTSTAAAAGPGRQRRGPPAVPPPGGRARRPGSALDRRRARRPRRVRRRARADRGRRRSHGPRARARRPTLCWELPAQGRRRASPPALVEGTVLAAYRFDRYKTPSAEDDAARLQAARARAHHDVARAGRAARASWPRRSTARATCRTRRPTT